LHPTDTAEPFNGRVFLEKFESAWNKNDTQTLDALFLENAGWVDIGGSYSKGKEQVTEQYFQLFKGTLKKNQLFFDFESLESKNVSQNTVLIVIDWQLEKKSELNNPISYIRHRKGILSLLLTPDKYGSWKISFAQGTLKIFNNLRHRH
jgi:hypothetical protein